MFGAKRRVRVGDEAPGFTLNNQEGKAVALSDFRGRPVVVYFYPKDDTPVCTAESCGFRDHYEDFRMLGAEVIGISSDGEASHREFADRHQLPFVLLTDPEGRTREAFGVPKALGVLPGRVTYVIDGAGIVRHAFNSQLNATRHVSESLDMLRRL